MYERLYPLQGHLIPVYYGEARCDGTRALVLSEVAGVVAFEQKSPPLDAAEFQRRLEASLRELGALGLAYDDVKLDNFLIIEDRIMFVDLDSVVEDEPDEVEYAISTGVSHLTRRYEGYLESLEYDW